MTPSAPPAPDYRGAAQEQAGAQRQLTAEQTYANRPDISTPWGGIQWTPPEFDPYYGVGGAPGGATGGAPAGTGARSAGIPERQPGESLFEALQRRAAEQGATGGAAPGAPGRWGMNVYLSPEQQAALESQQRIGAERSGLAEEMFGRVRGELGEAPDVSDLPGFGGAVGAEDVNAPALPEVEGLRGRAEQAIYERAASRLDPQWQQRRQELDVELRNQGMLPGSAAYERQMSNLERERERAYAGARQESVVGGGAEAQRLFGMGLGARQQALQEAGQRYGQRMTSSQYETQRRNAQLAENLQRRGWSLNEINALLSGQQIGMPQTPGFAQAGVSQAPNYFGAAQAGYQADLNRYNAQQAQLQSLMSGGFGLAGAALPFMF